MADQATIEKTDAPASVVEGREEMAFVERYTEKLEKGEVANDRGRVKAEREAREGAEKGEGKPESKGGKPAADPKDKSKSGNSDKGGTRSESDKGPGGDSEEGGDADKAKTPAKPKGEKADDDEQDDDLEEDDDENLDDDEDDDDDDLDDDEDDDDDEIEDDDEEALAKQTARELKKHGLNIKLSELPEEVRPLVEKQIKNASAALSRAMVEHRAYRKDEMALRTEIEFIKKHPEHFIASLLEAQGEELDKKVSDLINEAVKSPTAKKAFELTIRDLRQQVQKGLDDTVQANDRAVKRADEVVTYVRDACMKLDLDLDIIEEAVAAKIKEKPLAERGEGLTKKELDVIIGRHHRAIVKRTGERKREERKEEIKGTRRDRKETSPAARGSSGTVTPAPVGKTKEVKNDAEFTEELLASGRLRTGTRR